MKDKSKIKIDFNVAEISTYGNGGGSKVILNQKNNKDNKHIVGRIELNLPGKEFELGEYQVTFKKNK